MTFDETLATPTLTSHLGVEVRPSTAVEREQYLGYLRLAVEKLDVCVGSDGWWMVGGISRDAHIGNQAFVVKDPIGRWRDIDILVRDDRRRALSNFYRTYSSPVPVGGGTLQSCVRVLPEKVLLQFGGIREEVPTKTFDQVRISLGHVGFPTVSLPTLFHLYAVGDRPNGRMREKDFINALTIGRYLRSHPDDNFPEELYRGFHSFSRRKNNTDEAGLLRRLRVLAIKYKESPLNRVFPIDEPHMREVLDHVWRLMSDLSTNSSESKGELYQ